jgi:hypothetical protein
MFIPFTPHKIKLKDQPQLCEVVAMDITKKKMDIKEKPIEVKSDLSESPTMKIVIEPDTDEEDDIVSSRSIKVADIISIWLLIINPITNKYEWIRQSQCEPQVNKKLE